MAIGARVEAAQRPDDPRGRGPPGQGDPEDQGGGGDNVLRAIAAWLAAVGVGVLFGPGGAAYLRYRRLGGRITAPARAALGRWKKRRAEVRLERRAAAVEERARANLVQKVFLDYLAAQRLLEEHSTGAVLTKPDLDRVRERLSSVDGLLKKGDLGGARSLVEEALDILSSDDRREAARTLDRERRLAEEEEDRIRGRGGRGGGD